MKRIDFGDSGLLVYCLIIVSIALLVYAISSWRKAIKLFRQWSEISGKTRRANWLKPWLLIFGWRAVLLSSACWLLYIMAMNAFVWFGAVSIDPSQLHLHFLWPRAPVALKSADILEIRFIPNRKSRRHIGEILITTTQRSYRSQQLDTRMGHEIVQELALKKEDVH